MPFRVQPILTELSLSAQTAYAQLLEASLGAAHVRSVADLSGSFNAKTVKGRRYWYFQYTEPSGKLRQFYVGPDPARYALHKVLIAGEREGALRVEARKDLAQAAHLLSALWQWRRESLVEALDDLLSRGRGWQSRFRRGARALLEGWPELEAAPMLTARTSAKNVRKPMSRRS